MGTKIIIAKLILLILSPAILVGYMLYGLYLGGVFYYAAITETLNDGEGNADTENENIPEGSGHTL